MEALSHAYSIFHKLLIETHEQAKIICDLEDIKCDKASSKSSLTMNPPGCMVASEFHTLYLKLETGEFAKFFEVSHPHDPRETDEAKIRYGLENLVSPSGPSNLTLKQEAEYFFRIGKKMLQVDGGHGSYAFLFTEDGKMEIVQITPQDQADKYLLWRNLAKRVELKRVTKLIFISEVWVAPIDKENSLRHAVEAPDKKEALQLTAVSKGGENINLIQLFERKGEGIVFEGETQEIMGISGFLMPIMKVWKRME